MVDGPESVAASGVVSPAARDALVARRFLPGLTFRGLVDAVVVHVGYGPAKV